MKTNEPLAFVAGQHYTTRDGQLEARITNEDGPPHSPLLGHIKTTAGWDFMGWKRDGRAYGINTPMFDLTGPWIEKPVVNWAAMPAWAKWVAMDNDGQWYWFNLEPSISQSYFESDGGLCDMIHDDWAPIFTGDWRNSKVQRPQA